MVDLMLNNGKCTYFDKISDQYFIKGFGELIPNEEQILKIEQSFEFKRFVRNLLIDFKESGKLENDDEITYIGGLFKMPKDEYFKQSPLYETVDRNLMVDEIKRINFYHEKESKIDICSSYITDARNPQSFNYSSLDIRIPKIGRMDCQWGFMPDGKIKPYYLEIYKSEDKYKFNVFFKMFPRKKTVEYFKQLIGPEEKPIEEKTEKKEIRTFLSSLPRFKKSKVKIYCPKIDDPYEWALNN